MELEECIDINMSSEVFLKKLQFISKNDDLIKELLPYIEDEIAYINDNFNISVIGDIINVLKDDIDSWEGDEEIFAQEFLDAIRPYIK